MAFAPGLLVLLAQLARFSAPLPFWSPTTPLPMPYTQMLVASPTDEEILYAVAEDTSEASGLFVSDDGGATWVELAQIPAGEWIDSLAIDPADPSLLLRTTTTYHPNGNTTAVHRSPDGGATWQLSLDSGVLCGPVGFARAGAVALVGCGTQLYRTPDGGESWSSVLNPARPGPFVPAPDGSLFAVGYDDAILRTADDGSTWTVVGSTPSECSSVLSLGVSPESSLDLLVGAAEWIHFGLACGGLFRSLDGGATWDETLADRAVTQIAFDAHSPSRAFASMPGSGFATPFPLGAVYMTDDGGRTWSDLRLPEVGPDLPVVIALSASSRALYAFTYFGGTIFVHRFRRPTLVEAR